MKIQLVHYEPVSYCNLDKVIFNILEKLPEILVSNVSNGAPCLLFLVWNFRTEIQIDSHAIT